jgi:hypothetical protein
MLACGNALTPLIKSGLVLPNALLSSYILRLLALSLSHCNTFHISEQPNIQPTQLQSIPTSDQRL